MAANFGNSYVKTLLASDSSSRSRMATRRKANKRPIIGGHCSMVATGDLTFEPDEEHGRGSDKAHQDVRGDEDNEVGPDGLHGASSRAAKASALEWSRRALLYVWGLPSARL